MSQVIDMMQISPFNWTDEQKEMEYNRYLNSPRHFGEIHTFEVWFKMKTDAWVVNNSLFRDDDRIRYVLCTEFLDEGVVQIERFVDDIYHYTYEDMNLTWENGTPVNFLDPVELTHWIKTSANSPLIQDRIREGAQQ
jgi:hypothetical protein